MTLTNFTLPDDLGPPPMLRAAESGDAAVEECVQAPIRVHPVLSATDPRGGPISTRLI